MKRIRNTAAAAVVLALALVFTAQAALAAPHRIYSPTIGAPSIVPAGGSFNLTLRSKTESRVTSVYLLNKRGALVKTEVHHEDFSYRGMEKVAAGVPENLTPGMYDLCIDYETGYEQMTECRPDSVSVVDGIKDGFRFAVFSDYHVGDRRGESNSPGIPLEELRAKGIDALNEAKPDFVIVPGDMTNYPTSYRADYRRCIEEFAGSINAPVFIVPGNHDLYSMSSMLQDGKDYWKETFGPPHMAFTYGDFRFIGFNSYSWPEKYRDRYQAELIKTAGSGSSGIVTLHEFRWLREQIEAAKAAGLEVILFAHHDPQHMSSYEGDSKLKVMPKNEFAEYLRDAGVSYFFFGHTHRNYTRTDGGLTYVSTGTVSSGIRFGEAWSFRTVDVDAEGDLTMRVVNFWFPGKTE